VGSIGAIRCNPLTPVSFGQAQSFSLQQPAQLQRGRLDHEVPGDALARIKIEDEHVGTLDVIDAGVQACSSTAKPQCHGIAVW
jgi:hypothetical protein